MNPLMTLTGNELVWKQKRFGADHFCLFQEDRLYAEVYWPRILSESAVAKVSGRWWTFRRVGFLRDRIVATVGQTRRIAAVCAFDWLKDGSVKLASGRILDWYRTGVFSGAWALAESGGDDHLQIAHGYHWFKQHAWVSLAFPLADPELPLLLCLSLYLVDCVHRDEAATIAATGAAVTVV